jgi:hypothetical protein
MAGEANFWSRVSEEVRSVSDRTRASARRAVQIGVLRVDLVSLRRDRSRALSNLGARALALWDAGTAHAMESDAEALRLRAWIASIDEIVRVKRAELERLRAEPGAENEQDETTAGVEP